MSSGVGRKRGEDIRAKETLVESETTITMACAQSGVGLRHSASNQHHVIQYGTNSYLFETFLIGHCYVDQGGLKLVASTAQG